MSIKWQLDCCARISSKNFGKYVNGSIDREFCFKVEYLFILLANLLYRFLCQYVGDVLAYCPTVRSSDGLSVGPFQWLRCALLMAPRDSRASLIALRLASQTAPLVLLDGNVEPHEWLLWACQIAPFALSLSRVAPFGLFGWPFFNAFN